MKKSHEAYSNDNYQKCRETIRRRKNEAPTTAKSIYAGGFKITLY